MPDIANDVASVPAPRECTQTNEFKRWFRDSKVVDAAPLVVFHGTDVDFDAFDVSHDIGFHFGTIAQAEARISLENPGQWDDDGRIIPVYLAISNPLRLNDLHMWGPADVLCELVAQGILSEEETDEAHDDYIDCDFVRAALAAKGYDGIVYENKTEAGGDSYIVFDGRQVKSAIGNSGAFHPECADILDRNESGPKASRRLGSRPSI